MPFQPVPGTIGIVVDCRLSGEVAQNTLYFFQNGADPTVGDCIAVATIVKNFYTNALMPLLATTLIGVKVVAKNLFINGGAKGVVSMAGSAGGVATEQATNNDAAVVTFDTGQSGKSSHGRNYVPGIPNAAITVNTLDPDFMAGVIAAYETLLPGGDNDPAPYFWSVVSRQSGGIVAAEGLAVPVMNVYFTDDIIDSQRRRLPGRGK